MPQQPSTEFTKSQLLATIERQRRIICDLLIKNEVLRTQLMNIASSANEPPRREAITARFEPRSQTADTEQMHRRVLKMDSKYVTVVGPERLRRS